MNGSGIDKGCSDPYDVIGARIFGNTLTLSYVPSWVEPYETKGKYAGKPAGTLHKFQGVNKDIASASINLFAIFGADPATGQGSPLNSISHSVVVKWCRTSPRDANGGPYILAGMAGNMEDTGQITDDIFVVHDIKSGSTKTYGVNSAVAEKMKGAASSDVFDPIFHDRYLAVGSRQLIWYYGNNKFTGYKLWANIRLPHDNGNAKGGWIPQWPAGDPVPDGNANHVSSHLYRADIVGRGVLCFCGNDNRYRLETDIKHTGSEVTADLFLVGPREFLGGSIGCTPCSGEIDIEQPLGPGYPPGSQIGNDFLWAENFERRGDHFAGILNYGSDATETDVAWSTRSLNADGSLKLIPIPESIAPHHLHIDGNHDLVVAGPLGLAKITGNTWTKLADADAFDLLATNEGVVDKDFYTRFPAAMISSSGCCGGHPVYHVRGVFDVTPDYQFLRTDEFAQGIVFPAAAPRSGFATHSWVVSHDGQVWSPCRHQAPANQDGFDDPRLMTPLWFDSSGYSGVDNPAKGVLGAAFSFQGTQIWGGPPAPAMCSCGQTITEEI